ncbi:MAG: hypothetical protein AB1467_00720 [Candidatus Diapherotrites archaeon]
MRTISRKGFLFSLDLSFAFLLVLLMVFVMVYSLEGEADYFREKLKEKELNSKAIALMDSLVKNADENNSLLGSALYDSGLKRVQSNVMDYGLLKKIRKNEKLNFVNGIYLEFGGKKEKIFSEESSGNCIALSRFVLVQGILGEKKAKIIGVFCSE